MQIKTLFKSFFTFTKKDRVGILILILLIITAYLLPVLFSKEKETLHILTDPQIIKAVNKLNKNRISNNYFDEFENIDAEYKKEDRPLRKDLFSFDPNTLSAEGWQKLGLKEKTIKTIFNYRNKGGKFYKKEDLQKIWGLPKGFYESVQNYINIETERITSNYQFASNAAENTQRVLKKLDINKADTLSFIKLPGIGNTLARRIVNFRNKLGGFYSLDQIKETYGLPDSTFQKIKMYLFVDESGISTININTVTKEDLKVHPYIRWNLANAIVEYRSQHGLFNAIEELKNITIIDEATYYKVAPYFKL